MSIKYPKYDKAAGKYYRIVNSCVEYEPEIVNTDGQSIKLSDYERIQEKPQRKTADLPRRRRLCPFSYMTGCIENDCAFFSDGRCNPTRQHISGKNCPLSKETCNSNCGLYLKENK